MSSAFGDVSGAQRPFLQGRQVASLPERLPQAVRGKRLRITTIGEDVLHRRCQDVTSFGTPELKTLLDDMFATMEVASGVGLAANQVGVDLRLFVFDCPDDDDVRHVGHICNPEIDTVFGAQGDDEVSTEGCLSVPGPYADVSRTYVARVTGVDIHGTPVEFVGSGLLARCFQHETDHLNGTLYVDHLNTATRERALSEMDAMKQKVWSDWDERAKRLGKSAAVAGKTPTQK